MKNKKLVIAAIAFAAVIAILAGVALINRPQTSAGEKTVTVTVVHADATEKVFTYTTDAAYLGEVLLAEALVEGVEGPYGLEIHAVDGEGASWEENQSYWALFVGEEYAITGADSTPINDGDAFKLVYTIG